MADYPEHRDLHNIKNGVCYWCECPLQKMSNVSRRHERHNLWDQNIYYTLSDSNTPLSIANLKRHDVIPGFNILWYLDCVTSDLPKPDLLHTMQIWMLKHLLTWVRKFLKQQAKERHTELCAEWDAELEENKQNRAAFRQRIYDVWKGIIDAEMAEYIEEGSDFNFPKKILMQHFRE
ncbi:hypothetical protein K440DRAFT_641204 [Wilcoxina mikolae CBS 423.85]|nr:hypothetical protein K440DRAFT_641204 [Wilcoxina mikolae CBS 423.85]